ncbi:MAG: hypothetical protein IH627_11760 [Rubrivivax sp.]|nr:hypothetical protein [Rubrivivax sp.]
MDDRTTRLESAVEHLQLTVASLQQRLDAIEAKGLGGRPVAADAVAPSPTADGLALRPALSRTKDPYDPIAILSLIGRLLLVLAGGFFLRALTDAGTLAVPVGISLAFAYAAAWLFMCDRAGGRGQVPNAVVHALAAALIAFPLVVEATTRFKVLSGPTSAMVLLVLSAGLLFVAWRRRLRAGIWITVIGALPTSAAILVQTGVVVPFALYLIALGMATLWLSYTIDWWGSRWPAALAADIAVAGVTLRAFAPEHRDTPQAAMLLLALLLVGYLGSIAIRTLVRGRSASPFEIAQGAAALAVSLGGAIFMMRATGAVPAVLGVAVLVLGAACYGAAVALVDRRKGSALNFHFYTTLALVLVLAGVSIAIAGVWLGAVLALFGVLATGLWSRSGRLFALLHGAVYLVAAGIASGSLAYGLRTLVAGADGEWAVPDAVMLVVFAATALSAGLAAMRPTADDEELAIGTKFVIAIVLVWTTGGGLIGYIAPVAGGLAGRGVDPGLLATVSTGVLSVITLLVAWAGRHARFREWGWLVYPLLVGIGLKLVTQDFQHSRPATLFIALAMYGAALIVAPRLRRRVRKVAAQPDA